LYITAFCKEQGEILVSVLSRVNIPFTYQDICNFEGGEAWYWNSQPVFRGDDRGGGEPPRIEIRAKDL